MPIADVQRAYDTMIAKSGPYTTIDNYYHGKAPLVYSNRRLAELFRNLDARFTENWCAVVIDSACDRINLTGFSVKDEVRQAEIDALWGKTDLSLIADDVHEAALEFGESYVIAWPNAAGQVRVYFHDPRMCHVFYDDDDPYQINVACKWFDGSDGYRRLILYYPDHVERYVSSKKVSSTITYKSFVPDAVTPVVDNPFNEVPVFHFRMRRTIKSELENVIPLQNGVNKTLADMMVTAEYAAAPQRWVISQGDTSNLQNAPNRVWDLPAGDGVGQGTAVGQFAAADLKIYLDAVNHMAQAIGIISRTPKHYFFGQNGDPSGEALIAMEAPLVKKCADYINRFTPTWRSLFTFLLRLGGADIDPTLINPHFEDPATVQPKTRAEVRKLDVEAGIPLRTVLHREGWSEADLDEMEKDKAKERATQTASLASALVQAQREQDQGEPAEEVTPVQPVEQIAPSGTPQQE